MWLLLLALSSLAGAADAPAAQAAPAKAAPTQAAPAAAPAPAPPTILDKAAAARLRGAHALTVQWISWDVPGSATVEVDAQGVWHLHGEQAQGGNWVKVDGVVQQIDARSFVLVGEVTLRVDHIANGEPCTRSGALTFTQSGKRRYWRMQQMQSPCDVTTDYVDIYLRPGE